jgi:anti-sigma B factor antagonist
MVSRDLPFSVNIVHEDGSVVLALAGELDIATRPVLRQAVAELLSPHLQAVTLDLRAVYFADISGLRGLVDVKEMAEGVQAEFRLRSVDHLTRRVIRLADFDELEAAILRDATASDV